MFAVPPDRNVVLRERVEYSMKLFRSLALIFIDVFEITHPSPERT